MFITRFEENKEQVMKMPFTISLIFSVFFYVNNSNLTENQVDKNTIETSIVFNETLFEQLNIGDKEIKGYSQ